jgi:hypothetical protein
MTDEPAVHFSLLEESHPASSMLAHRLPMAVGPARRYTPLMATITFDTLKLARKLEMAGFPQKQAADTAETPPTAWAKAKGDVAELKAGIRALVELSEPDSMTRLDSMHYVPSWPGLSRPSTPRRRHSAKLSRVDARIKSAHDESDGA